MIAEGDGQGGKGDEQVDDGTNTDIYLNMSGDRCEVPSGDDDAAADQDANVNITTALFVFSMIHVYVNFVAVWIIVAAEKDEARPDKEIRRVVRYNGGSSRW